MFVSVSCIHQYCVLHLVVLLCHSFIPCHIYIYTYLCVCVLHHLPVFVCLCRASTLFLCIALPVLCVVSSSIPPNIALTALFSDEVRPTCSKIPSNFPLVQMINNQSNLRLTINIFSVYIFEPIYHLILCTNLKTYRIARMRKILYRRKFIVAIWQHRASVTL